MPLLPGLFALLLITGAIGAGFGGLLLAAGPNLPELPWTYVGRIVRFTLFQAALSTLLSLALGSAVALALSRRFSFPGRGLFLAAMNLASVLPPIVAVFGIVSVFGRAGWVGHGVGLFGVDLGGWLYGMPGILLAHVFFNASLAARVMLTALAAVPGEQWRLAEQLGMGTGSVFRFIDLPVLLRESPATAALIFLLCFTSFAVVLALGGGPGSATLEVAIYEAVRFDVDFARAALLAFLQILVCTMVVLLLLRIERRHGESGTTGIRIERPDRAVLGARMLDAFSILIGAGLFLPPLAAVLLAGLYALGSLAQADVLAATATSFAIAVPASLLASVMALSLAGASRALLARRRRFAAKAFALPGALVLAVPPVALSAGLFATMRPLGDPSSFALPLMIFVNSLMALPFALRQVQPALTLSAERYGQLAGSLGIAGANRIRLVDWPLLRRPLAGALALAAALSLGDLGVAAFFGTGRINTLPLLLYERLGSYRVTEAASAALLLAALVFGLLIAAQRWAGDPIARSR